MGAGFKLLLAIAGTLLLISMQHLALDAMAVRTSTPTSCAALDNLLQPATIGAIAGACVAVIGALGTLYDRMHPPAPRRSTDPPASSRANGTGKG